MNISALRWRRLNRCCRNFQYKKECPKYGHSLHSHLSSMMFALSVVTACSGVCRLNTGIITISAIMIISTICFIIMCMTPCLIASLYSADCYCATGTITISAIMVISAVCHIIMNMQTGFIASRHGTYFTYSIRRRIRLILIMMMTMGRHRHNSRCR